MWKFDVIGSFSCFVVLSVVNLSGFFVVICIKFGFVFC